MNLATGNVDPIDDLAQAHRPPKRGGSPARMECGLAGQTKAVAIRSFFLLLGQIVLTAVLIKIALSLTSDRKHLSGLIAFPNDLAV